MPRFIRRIEVNDFGEAVFFFSDDENPHLSRNLPRNSSTRRLMENVERAIDAFDIENDIRSDGED